MEWVPVSLAWHPNECSSV